MGDKSSIEWTDATWNPTVGCSIVSPGCTNCYAMKTANSLERRFASKKYAGLTKVVNGNVVWTGEVRLDEDALLQPLKWKRGRKIFVNSMSDLFHEALSDEDIDRVFAVMALCPQHTFQVLTKRAERMRSYFNGPYPDGNGVAARIADATWALAPSRKQLPEPPVFCEVPVGPRLANGEPEFGWRRMLHPKMWPLPNVWLGVSCERQQEADERIPLLLQTPAAVRFISAEPLLGAIDLTRLIADEHCIDAINGRGSHNTWPGTIPIRKLDWVITGGESGPGARPMHPDWARSLRDQCMAAGVPFHFKQWGEWAPPRCEEHLPARPVMVRAGDIVVRPDGRHAEVDSRLRLPEGFQGTGSPMRRVGKKAAGRRIDGREHNESPI